jgi:hypothetical protein
MIEPAGQSASAQLSVDRDELITHGREVFARFTDATNFNVIDLPDGLGILLIHAVRGGGKLYVAPDLSVLFSNSSQNYQTGLAAFQEGRRTTGEKLVPLSQRSTR